MTKKSYGIDYSKGKIYKIVCNITNLIYIGSTTKDYLKQRLTKHKETYSQYLKGNYRFCTSFEILKNDNYDIVLLELVPCTSKDELLARERYYIETLASVNKCIPGQTKKEWGKKYREKNKEYRENNKETILEKKKEYYAKNKEKLNERHREKLNCDCGGHYIRCHIQRHFRTKQHCDFISQSNDAIVAS